MRKPDKHLVARLGLMGLKWRGTKDASGVEKGHFSVIREEGYFTLATENKRKPLWHAKFYKGGVQPVRFRPDNELTSSLEYVLGWIFSGR